MIHSDLGIAMAGEEEEEGATGGAVVNLQALPLELLRAVAARLSSRDLASLAGSCRLLPLIALSSHCCRLHTATFSFATSCSNVIMLVDGSGSASPS